MATNPIRLPMRTSQNLLCVWYLLCNEALDTIKMLFSAHTSALTDHHQTLTTKRQCLSTKQSPIFFKIMVVLCILCFCQLYVFPFVLLQVITLVSTVNKNK